MTPARRRPAARGTLCLVVLMAGSLTACSADPDPADNPGSSDAAQGQSAADPGLSTAETPSGTDTSEATEEPDASEDTATPSEEPEVIAGIAPDAPPAEINADESGEEIIEPFVEVNAEILATPEEPDLDKVVTVAAGPAQEQLRAALAEFADNGWVQEGAPSIVSSSVESIDPDADPPTAEVEVCLDHSGVDIVDTSGTSVVDPNAEQRILTTFTMHYLDDRWVLYQQSFDDDTEC